MLTKDKLVVVLDSLLPEGRSVVSNITYNGEYLYIKAIVWNDEGIPIEVEEQIYPDRLNKSEFDKPIVIITEPKD